MIDCRARSDLASLSINSNESFTGPSSLGSPVPIKLPVESTGLVLYLSNVDLPLPVAMRLSGCSSGSTGSTPG